MGLFYQQHLKTYKGKQSTLIVSSAFYETSGNIMRLITTIACVAFSLIAITACNNTKAINDSAAETQNAEYSLTSFADSLKTQTTCEENGGVWQKVGRLQRFACVLPAPDAGMACTDSSQCQVACVVKQEGVSAGTAVEGVCHSNTLQFGCRTYVTNGKAEATLCID